jgi:hypothetical protein
MIDSFRGMDFGQFDHLTESIFFEHHGQPDASSSSQQFPYGHQPDACESFSKGGYDEARRGSG